MDTHDYNDALQTIVRPLTEAAGIEALDLLADLLTRAIRVSRRLEEEGKSPHDLSWTWRPAIEEHEQNGGDHDVRAVRDAAEHLVANGGATGCQP